VGALPTRRAMIALLAAYALVVAGALAACGGKSSSSKSSTGSVDDGTTITMWTRAATQTQSQRLVDAYNASHKNHVKLTVIPTDSYQQKVGAAAGSKQLPDLFASDVIYAPNYTSKGLYKDISGQVKALPYYKSLAPGHMRLGTYQGKIYTVPHTIDMSVLFYNKALYRRAGLDPDKPPTTLKEFADQARTINKLGGDVHGTFFGGNCPGCMVFTMWPSVWAAGGDVMNSKGTKSTIDSSKVVDVLRIYRQLYDDGITAPTTKTEPGPTWTGVFPQGNIGVMPMPSTTLGLMPANMDVGVAPIPGPDGGQSTFVGGDVIGVSATSKHAAQAWNFLAWSLSDQTQVEIVAKNRDIVTRSDLASNKYSAADPRVVLSNKLLAKGKTPYSLNFGQTYNDPNGPWLQVARDALFGPDLDKALQDGAGKLTASLSQQN
jgi:multiple sugar transport system substrate-binding protein